MVKLNLPPTFGDTSGVIFLITATIVTYLFELIVVVPYVDDNAPMSYFHMVCGTFILLNILSNLFMLIKTDTSTSNLMFPSILKPNWRFCVSCEANSPPRSYHCDTCKRCILKRDHHCVFSGCCIGYKNFRYYLALIMYLSIGCLYASVMNMFFIWDFLGGFGFKAILYHLFPFPFWLLGTFSLKITFYILISLVNLLGFLFASALSFYHGNLLIRNQTTYERNKQINTYDLEYWKYNVIESLGRNWFLALIGSPLFKSQLLRDGIDFPTKKDYQDPNKFKPL